MADNIRLDPKTIQAVKIEAAKDGITMKVWLSRLVTAELERREKESQKP